MARKYFTTRGKRHGVLQGTMINTDGERKEQYLFKAATMPMQRHTKITAAANPYDPAWEVCFEARLGVKMAANLRGRRRLRNLWKAQNGLCPICHQKITPLTGWHNHHIVWRSLGGSDKTDHRVLRHPNCHRQVHNQGLEVVKPRPATGV